MNYQSLSEQVKQYSLGIFSSEKNDQLLYHDLAHTDGVVRAAIQISNHYQLNDHDFFVVYASVWFHDTGYFSADTSEHEKKGAERAAAYLASLGVDEATINQVKSCIQSTTVPQRPVTLLEKIVCDADMFHLGTDGFADRNKLMRKECEARQHSSISKEEWRQAGIQLLQSHQFHTDYCRLLLNAKKQENLDRLLQKQSEVKAKEKAVEKPMEVQQPFTELSVAPPDIPVGKKNKKGELADRPDKGVETMFRVASTNSQRLSDLSDNKAHIMISVNSIIISVIIGLVVRRLDASPNIIIPTLILLTGSMLAVIFSVLATRPKIPRGVFTKAQVEDKSANLLFFGNFYNMEFGDYYDGMKKVMADREFLYGSLIRDIYSQGTVLGRKYKLLRISYTIFMYTLIISIIAFAIATIFFG
ncbi:MAG: Pycsar system effector family protein [Ferruginibacter sp.]